MSTLLAPVRGGLASPADFAPPIDASERAVVSMARQLGEQCARAQGNRLELVAIEAELDRGEGSLGGSPLRGRYDLGDFYSAVVERIGERLVAGLLVCQADIAERRGLGFELSQYSRLRRLPAAVDQADAVSIVGNLIQNAFDAVAGAPPGRRRVSLLLSDAEGGLRVRVRDWGHGLEGVADEQLLSHGFTTKSGHPGVGLALVRDLAEAAGGRLSIERLRLGTAFEVEIPGWQPGVS